MRPASPVCGASLAGALDPTGDDLLSVDVLDLGVLRVGVLVNLQRDRCVAYGCAREPADSLL